MNVQVSPAAQPATLTHFIEGRPYSDAEGEFFDLLDPEDDRLLARVARGTARVMDQGVRSAAQAFESYSQSTASEREQWLFRLVQCVERDRDQFIDILIREGGSPIVKARREVQASLDNIRAAIGLVRHAQGATIPSDTVGKLSLTLRSPLGVIACITPFNVPFITASRSVGNALALGNTIVVLPSEEVPGIALKLAQLVAEAGFPAGVFNVVTGLGYEVGDSLTTHPMVRAVMFTGSTVVGEHVRKLCGEHGKHVTLELGGKSPLVILADADLGAAVTAAVKSIFFYQGQICLGASRLFIERAVHEPFLARFKAAAEGLVMGDLRDPSTVVGPIISPRQRRRVGEHISDAVGKGARLVTGGTWIGHRCRPTILSGVTPDMAVCASETFGPVACVYPVDSFEEALRRANDTAYGLTSGIFTADLGKAMTFVRSIRAGMAHVNGPTVYDEPHAPFGGVKDSGFGREGTGADLENWTELKWVTIQL